MGIGYSLLWDDDTGDFMLVDGSLVLASDDLSILEWLHCNLGVEEGKYQIYQNTGIGIPLIRMLETKGRVAMDTIFAVIKTKIEETALACQWVASVDSVTLERQGNSLHIIVSITTANGESVTEEEEITL